ncbi:MAG: hypothetical protein RLZZ148_2732, partial [Cyanobacteriota bacterium]
RAQPVSLAHHLLAYFQMAERDWQRLGEVRARTNISPLGCGALAGTTFPIDRHYSAELLGFQEVYGNSLDGVSDRDFAIELAVWRRKLSSGHPRSLVSLPSQIAVLRVLALCPKRKIPMYRNW